MNEEKFFASHQADWAKLRTLCDRAEVSASFLSAEEFKDLVQGYRKASADLAVVRTYSGNEELAESLNRLVAEAYSIIYRRPNKSFGRVIGDALTVIANTFRRRIWFVAFSAALFLIFSWLGFFVEATNPLAKSVFFGSTMAQKNLDAWTGNFKGEERGLDTSTMMTGFYASNNPKAAIMTAGASVVTFGIGTVFVDLENGLNMGTLAAEMAKRGRFGFLIVHILPHGVTELSGFMIASAAGFVLGLALIRPGKKKRGAALAEAGQDAIVLLSTAVIMMFMAAPIEGFFSYNEHIPEAVKVIFATVEATAWAVFWIGYGRQPALPPTTKSALSNSRPLLQKD